jgi:hypothetical protein
MRMVKCIEAAVDLAELQTHEMGSGRDTFSALTEAPDGGARRAQVTEQRRRGSEVAWYVTLLP